MGADLFGMDAFHGKDLVDHPIVAILKKLVAGTGVGVRPVIGKERFAQAQQIGSVQECGRRAEEFQALEERKPACFTAGHCRYGRRQILPTHLLPLCWWQHNIPSDG